MLRFFCLFIAFITPSFAQNAALGEYLAAECATCHQVSGKSNGIPPIVGYPQEAFILFMNEYKNKTRTNSQMQAIAAKFNDEEIAALAAYFASK